MRCTRAVPGRVVRRFYYSLRIMQKYNILELNEKLLPELQSIAEELGIKKVSSLKKEELVYRILDEQAISYAGIQAEKEKEKEAKKAERQTKAKKTKAAAPKGAKQKLLLPPHPLKFRQKRSPQRLRNSPNVKDGHVLTRKKKWLLLLFLSRKTKKQSFLKARFQ